MDIDIDLVTDYLKHLDRDFEYVSHYGNDVIVIMYNDIGGCLEDNTGQLNIGLIDLISFVYLSMKNNLTRTKRTTGAQKNEHRNN